MHPADFLVDGWWRLLCNRYGEATRGHGTHSVQPAEHCHLLLPRGPVCEQTGHPVVAVHRCHPAYEMITGYAPPPINLVTSQTNQEIRDALNDGRLVFVHRLDDPVLPAGLIPTHQYQVMRFVDPARTIVRLRNPHGSNDVTIVLSVLLTAIKGWE